MVSNQSNYFEILISVLHFLFFLRFFPHLHKRKKCPTYKFIRSYTLTYALLGTSKYVPIAKPYLGKPSSKKPFLHSGRLSKLSSTIRNTNSSLTNLPASISVLISFPEAKNLTFATNKKTTILQFSFT